MLYLIYGEDTYSARKKTQELVDGLSLRDPKAVVYKFDDESVTEETLSDLVCDTDLFGRKSVVVFDGVLKSECAEFLTNRAGEMAGSKNVYIILEKKIEAKLAKKISKFAQKTLKLDGPSEKDFKGWLLKEAKKRGVSLSSEEAEFLSANFKSNLWGVSQALEMKSLGGDLNIGKFSYKPFELADLFSQKNRRGAYRCFHKNLSEGVSAEEMFWKLWWQVKALLAVSACKEDGLKDFQVKSRTGLHPYVIQKSSSALAKFSREELENIWDELFLLWRRARSSPADLGLGLEKILLGLR